MAIDKTNTSLEYAKQLIDEYCHREFDHEADFSDLTNVGLAYTDIVDSAGIEHPVQVSVNLVEPAISMYVDGNLLEQTRYNGIKDFIKQELVFLDFDALVRPRKSFPFDEE